MTPAEKERIEGLAGGILEDAEEQPTPLVFDTEHSLAQTWAAIHKLHAVPLSEEEDLFCGEWMGLGKEDLVN